MSSRQPQPRWRHASFGIGSKHYLWGGLNGSSAKILATQIETFDILSAKWEEPQTLQGSLPVRLWGMAVTTDGENAYLFGGYDGSTRINNIYEINSRTLQCREIQPAGFSSPPAISRSRVVYFNEKLVVCGGYTDQGYTYDLYVFDIKKSECGKNPRLTNRLGPGLRPCLFVLAIYSLFVSGFSCTTLEHVKFVYFHRL